MQAVEAVTNRVPSHTIDGNRRKGLPGSCRRPDAYVRAASVERVAALANVYHLLSLLQHLLDVLEAISAQRTDPGVS